MSFTVKPGLAYNRIIKGSFQNESKNREEKKMRKHLKQVLSLSLSAAVAVSLAACGNGGGEERKPVKAQGGALGAYEETVVCTMGRSTIANPKFPDGDTYEDNAYTRYMKERLNVEVQDEFEANGEDYDRQVSLAIASGELPDVMRVGSKDILDELVENDLVEDLTEVYEEYASDYIKEIYDSYEGRCLETATYDGRLMALPGTNPDSAPCEVYIRQDWLDKLDLKIDEDGDRCLTIDELEEVASTFLKEDPDGSGNPVGMAFVPYLVSGDYGGSGYTMNAIASAYKAFPGSWMEDENGELYNGSVTEEMKQALAKMAEWFEEGILDPQFGTRTWDDITALLTNGQMGIAFGPWHIPDWLLNNVRSMNPEADFSAYTICDDEGKVNVVHNNANSGYMVVRKDYSNPEVLVKMANLFFDDIVNNKNLEDEAPEVSEYVKTVDNSAKPFQVEVNSNTSLLDDYSDIKNCVEGTISIDEVRTAESKTIVEAVNRYLEAPESADAGDWSKYTSRMGGIQLIESLTDNDQFVWYSPVFFDTTETMKTNSADLDKLREEVFVAIVTGSKSVDEFDTFMEDWNSRGGEQILKEIEEKIENQ